MVYNKNNANRLITIVPISTNRLFLLKFSIGKEGILAHMVVDDKNKL